MALGRAGFSVNPDLAIFSISQHAVWQKTMRIKRAYDPRSIRPPILEETC
jgi:hypothetical protein